MIFKHFEIVIAGNTNNIIRNMKNQQQYKPTTTWGKSKLMIQRCTTKLFFFFCQSFEIILFLFLFLFIYHLYGYPLFATVLHPKKKKSKNLILFINI